MSYVVQPNYNNYLKAFSNRNRYLDPSFPTTMHSVASAEWFGRVMPSFYLQRWLIENQYQNIDLLFRVHMVYLI